MRRINLSRMALAIALAACRRDAALSTEEMVGEWERSARTLPPIDLLITAEGTDLRARLRLSGAEAHGRVKVEGRHLTVKFDGPREPIQGDFLTKTEMRLQLRPNGDAYVLRKKP